MPKLNFGHAMAIAVSLFIIFTSSFVYFTTTVDVDLVREDYYNAVVHFDETKIKKKNSKIDKQYFTVQKTNSSYQLTYSDSNSESFLTGILHMYYPADDLIDTYFELKDLKKNNFILPFRKTGKWVLKIDWKVKEKAYYQEKEIFVEYE